MSFVMMYLDAIWTRPQLTDHLSKIAYLLKSKVFNSSIPFTVQSQLCWMELIGEVSDLVRQAALSGKRINFTDEVSAYDQFQDITSLLDAMRQSAFVIQAITPAQRSLKILSPALNQFNGVGSGQFANGLLFTCPHKNERAFFIGRDRVYFYRHLIRAYIEAGRYLTSLP
ncbi:hypothetical protein ACFSUS_21490 [Spirosoma soli]|uniref:Uncharacterized protein n=1 Tax=Spirosoma soli TaxID=1770529 RepID=A0ABW5MAX7_9BACT